MAAFSSSKIDEILPQALYLGSLFSALSPENLEARGITHVVPVCSEYPSTNAQGHLHIPVADTEHEDLLQHMPRTCKFIDEAIQEGGVVFVHCMYGVSRSATMVSAYLMMTRRMSPSAAIRFVKTCRPGIHPNPGFIQQLTIFSDCEYEPSNSHPVYNAWKARQVLLANLEQDGKQKILEPVTVIRDVLYITTDMPDATDIFVSTANITHLIIIAPTRIDIAFAPHTNVGYSSFHVDSQSFPVPEAALLLLLPEIIHAIKNACEHGGRVLLYGLIESRLAIVVCAYLMHTRGIPASDAFAVLLEALPLFESTRNFQQHLDLFEACEHQPTPNDPRILAAWSTASAVSAAPASTTDYLQILKIIQNPWPELWRTLKRG